MEIAVLGTGYVGLVTTAVFSELGHRVIGVDIDEARVQRLALGESPIFEPGLEAMLARNLASGRLSFTADTAAAVRDCPVIFIAVGTPSGDDGATDLSQVDSAVRAIADAATGHRTIVDKSTVPVGTGARVQRQLATLAATGASFDVLSNPEFLREGSALEDALHPDRIIIGAPHEEAARPLQELYSSFACPILVTDVASAEMIKYASNAFLAAKISFINTIADLCEETGADARNVARGMGMDERIGAAFLNAGIGYGGSCFPKDIDSLIHETRQLGHPSALLEAVRRVNEQRVPRLLARVADAAGGLTGKTVAVLGLTFKPDTDDLRASQSLALCRQLLEAGAVVRAHDPIALESGCHAAPGIICCANAQEAAAGADMVLLATEWRDYRVLDLPALRAVMHGDLFVDGRNAYQPSAVEAAGLRYLGVGRRFAAADAARRG